VVTRVVHQNTWCRSGAKPTTRPRPTTNESDRLARVIENAGVLYPEAHTDKSLADEAGWTVVWTVAPGRRGRSPLGHDDEGQKRTEDGQVDGSLDGRRFTRKYRQTGDDQRDHEENDLRVGKPQVQLVAKDKR
jgi:hypothetical protein